MSKQTKLNPKILEYLIDKTGKKKQNIRNKISELKRKFPTAPLNCVAHIYAEKHGLSVRKFIPAEEKKQMPGYEIQKQKEIVKTVGPKKEEVLKKIITYCSNNKFVNEHIGEINRAYTYKCYTSVFILTRKVFENLIVGILEKKYPKNVVGNLEIYFDKNGGRYLDFSVVLDNLYSKRMDFLTEKTLVEKIFLKLKPFKNDANDKVHSLYHLVSKKREIDDKDIGLIFDLIEELEKKVDI
jgi:hypothetical protein